MPTRSTMTSRVREASTRRRREHRTETRDVIFRAAVELLDAAGYDGFSLRKLAERIGYTPTTIYRYFRDRDELVGAVMLEGYAEFTRALQAAIASRRDPFEQVDALGEAYVEFGLTHPVMYRVLFMQRPDIWLRLPPDRVEAVCGEDAFQLVTAAVTRAIATGATHASDVEATALALWAATHGVVSLCLAMPSLTDPAKRRKMIDGALALASLRRKP